MRGGDTFVLFLLLEKRFQSFTIEYGVNWRLVIHMVFIMLRNIPSLLSLLRVLIMKGYDILSNDFPATIEMTQKNMQFGVQNGAWSTKWSREKTIGVLSKKHTCYSKHPFPRTQEKTLNMDIIKWSLLKWDWLCYYNQRWRSSIQSAETRPGGDCGSEHQLFIAKFRLKLKKVGKTTSSFRYDLNQIPYDYIVEVTNSFKGLNLVDGVPEELWT